ncbi:hypothetical protein [uncultured Bifidobacterium sp.]|uniref:hypothetical protein n=1 Tax=uncultured Bifidobacterium sp. TaxID=165187 RepID=UPI0026388112|nr:hypothetical protein [uncultured Bifidobacterium sp.]
MSFQHGSITTSGTAFTPPSTGSRRPSRPGQLAPGTVEHLAGGMDPQAISEMSHVSAAALLDRVHHSTDPQIVGRVLTVVDTEGVDIIAELWSNADPDSLPGILWRLYMLRSWMHREPQTIARLWSQGEPVATSASAIAGLDSAPTADDIAHTADSILSGAFTGDFAIALDRASAFTAVIANGLRSQAQTGTDIPQEKAQLVHRAANLHTTSSDFHHGAALWRRGRLE